MATTEDIRDIFGLSKSKIDTWARGRDGNYLLVQFLKSFSSIDLESRLDTILKKNGKEKKKPHEFIDMLLHNLTISGIREFEGVPDHVEIKQIRSACLRDIADLVVDIDGKIYVIEFKHLIPSKLNLIKEIKIIHNHIQKCHLELERIIYISSNRSFSSALTKDLSIVSIASFYDFDIIAHNLYGKKVILAGYL